MKDFIFYSPTKMIFGRNAEARTGKAASECGKRAMLVFGKSSVQKSGLLARVERSLADAGVSFYEFGGAQTNPTLAHAEEGVRAALAFGTDMVIGIGGGSAIDTAKAIAHGCANPDVPLWDIWTGKVPLTRSLPVGAVLTIPAAGSEMSDSAVLTNEIFGKKAGISTPFNRCRFAVVNPALAATLPVYPLAAGIADIMMHTMERYFIPDSHCELTDEIAEGLLRTVIANGAKVVKDPSDYDAMCEVFWASSLSHNDLTGCGRSKDFSVHKLGHALSARYGVIHGASLSSVWKFWADALYANCPARFARFARRVWGVTEADDLLAAREGIRHTAAYFASIGLPVSLRELTEDDLDALADNATEGDTLRLSRIRKLDKEAVKAIFAAARG